jgi:hypothetical protein
MFLEVLAAECTSGADADRFIAALLSAFATFIARKVEDPAGYLLGWIAVELELADHDDNGPEALN